MHKKSELDLPATPAPTRAEKIARTYYETLRAFSGGTFTWEELSDETRAAAAADVEKVLSGPSETADQQHQSWTSVYGTGLAFGPELERHETKFRLFHAAVRIVDDLAGGAK